MSTKARRLLGGWTPPIRFPWLTCVVTFAWLLGRDPNTFGEGGDDSLGTSATLFLVVASVLGLVFGVAMVKERRTSTTVPTVLATAALGTAVTSIAYLSTGASDDIVGLTFVSFVLALGVPVGAGVLLGAMWRLVLRLLGRKSTHGAI